MYDKSMKMKFLATFTFLIAIFAFCYGTAQAQSGGPPTIYNAVVAADPVAPVAPNSPLTP